MPPVEHQLHEEFNRDDDLFGVSGGSNADRVAMMFWQCQTRFDSCWLPFKVSPSTPHQFSASFILLFRLIPPLFQSSLQSSPAIVSSIDGLSSSLTPSGWGLWLSSSLTWSVNMDKCPPGNFVYSTHTHILSHTTRCCATRYSYSGILPSVCCASTFTVSLKSAVNINMFPGNFLLFNVVYSLVCYLGECLKLCTHRHICFSFK